MKIENKYTHVVWLSGMPRSGTNWLSQIFASSPQVRLKLCPLFSYEFKNLLDESSLAKDWIVLFDNVYKTKSEYLDQDYLRKRGLVPQFPVKNEYPEYLVIKSTRFHNLVPHILELLEGIQFIHIVRHPCAVIYSWITNAREFPQGADPIKEWKSGKCRKTGPGEFWGFDDWKFVNSQALGLRARFPGRFKIIRYEDLVSNTFAVAKDMFNFIGLSMHQQTEEFIYQSHSKHDINKRSVYKHKILNNEWMKGLDPSIISECMNDLAGTDLEQYC